MTADASPLPAAEDTRSLTWSRLSSFAAIAFLAVLPAATVLALFVGVVQDDSVALDLGQFYGAAEAILRGEDPYAASTEPLTQWGGPYPYPPLPALLATPLTPLPLDVAGLLVMAVLVGVALAVLAVIGVRDWRCYGALLLWPPVISAIQTGNVTLWLALAAAVAWRFRDRLVPVAVSVGVALAAKFLLWPLVVWLAATRRVWSAVAALGVGVAVLVASWAVIGFAGLTAYPGIARDLEAAVGQDSYTAYIVGLDAGLPSDVARGAWLAVGLALLASSVLLARRGDERTAFILAVAAALALTPIVWLHYFALLSVVVALAQPRLGLVWFVPLGMFLTPGSGHPTPFQTSWTLLVAVVTVALAVRASRGSSVAFPRAETVT
jgi:alpha-1,2-mannosyltransferase